jgi:hypothetical protein
LISNPEKSNHNQSSRRFFLKSSAAGAAALAFSQFGCTSSQKLAKETPKIQGFEDQSKAADPYKGWVSFSDRKIKVGLVGYGVCKFGADFGFQNHPNVEVVAVSDLIPERCAEMAKVCKCSKTYPSLEELVKGQNH